MGEGRAPGDGSANNRIEPHPRQTKPKCTNIQTARIAKRASEPQWNELGKIRSVFRPIGCRHCLCTDPVATQCTRIQEDRNNTDDPYATKIGLLPPRQILA